MPLDPDKVALIEQAVAHLQDRFDGYKARSDADWIERGKEAARRGLERRGVDIDKVGAGIKRGARRAVGHLAKGAGATGREIGRYGALAGAGLAGGGTLGALTAAGASMGSFPGAVLTGGGGLALGIPQAAAGYGLRPGVKLFEGGKRLHKWGEQQLKRSDNWRDRIRRIGSRFKRAKASGGSATTAQLASAIKSEGAKDRKVGQVAINTMRGH